MSLKPENELPAEPVVLILTTFCRDVFWQDGVVIPGCDDNGVFFMNSGYLYILKDQFSVNREKVKFRSRIKNLLHECQLISFLDSKAYPPF